MQKVESYTTTDPAELWLLLKQGDREAFRLIYDHFFEDLFSFGMLIVPNRMIVLDAIQELFVSLWTYQSGLSNVTKVKSYLYKSLRSEIVKKLVAEKKFEHLNNDYDEGNLAYLYRDDDDFSDKDFEDLRSKNLRIMINELPLTQREAVVMIFFEGNSYEDTARILNMNINSVYNLIWKAVSTLKRKYFADAGR